MNTKCTTYKDGVRSRAIPLGVIAVALSLLFHRAAAGTGWGDFLEGLFLGLGVTLAIYGLARTAAARRHE